MSNLPTRRRTALGLALTAGVVLALQLVGVSSAQARCDGVNRPLRSTLGAGTVFVVEQPVTQPAPGGTCNGNNLYQATVRADLGPDRIGMVGVWIQNGGAWRQLEYTNSRTGAAYSYRDNNSNSFMTLCWYEPAAGAGVAHCGWGSTYGPVGTTPGSHPQIYNQPGYHGVNSGF